MVGNPDGTGVPRLVYAISSGSIEGVWSQSDDQEIVVFVFWCTYIYFFLEY